MKKSAVITVSVITGVILIVFLGFAYMYYSGKSIVDEQKAMLEKQYDLQYRALLTSLSTGIGKKEPKSAEQLNKMKIIFLEVLSRPSFVGLCLYSRGKTKVYCDGINPFTDSVAVKNQENRFLQQDSQVLRWNSNLTYVLPIKDNNVISYYLVLTAKDLVKSAE